MLKQATLLCRWLRYLNVWCFAPPDVQLCNYLQPPPFSARCAQAVKYARESKTPFLGICLGMQCAVIEYSR